MNNSTTVKGGQKVLADSRKRGVFVVAAAALEVCDAAVRNEEIALMIITRCHTTEKMRGRAPSNERWSSCLTPASPS